MVYKITVQDEEGNITYRRYELKDEMDGILEDMINTLNDKDLKF